MTNLNVEVSDQNTVALIFSNLALNALGILLRYSEAVVRKCSVKRAFLHFTKFIGKQVYQSRFFHKVTGRLEEIPAHLKSLKTTFYITPLDNCFSDTIQISSL